MPCCDVCAPGRGPGGAEAAARSGAPRGGGGRTGLDGAIVAVVVAAEPPVGRTRAVEILRGGRAKVVQKYTYDGLPGYGAFAHLRNDDVLERVDALIAAGRLRSTGGAYPKLRAAGGATLADGVARMLASACWPPGRAPTWRRCWTPSTAGRGADRRGRLRPGGRLRAGARATGGRARRGSSPRADHATREARDLAIADWLAARGAQLVVLAGYMQLLGARFLARFPDAVINVHPALLPAFPGIGAIEQAVDYGVKVTGVTVHFVDEGVDTGPDRPPGGDRAARRRGGRRGRP